MLHDQSRKRSLTQHYGKMAQAPCWEILPSGKEGKSAAMGVYSQSKD